MIERWRARKFLPLPGAVGQVGPIDQREFLQQTLAVRTSECKVGVGNQVRLKHLVDRADLLDRGLHILGGLSTP